MDLLRHLRFFAAVADARHFGDAARDLGMTQPPLSQGIKKLERRLGVRLFDRDARGVRVTPAGQRLLPSARELLELEDDLLDQAQGLAVPDRIRVGVAADLEGLIPDVVAAVAHSGPAVAPTVAGSVELTDQLRHRLLDVAVVRHPGVLDGLRAGPVLVVPTRLALAHGHGAPVPLSRIALPIAVPPRHHQPPAHDQFVDALRRSGHSGDVIETADLSHRRALSAAASAQHITPTRHETGDPDLPPLRLRVAIPLPAHRRPEVDHEAAAAMLEGALGR